MSGKIVANAAKHGAEAIVVACPMCHSNLDMRRPEINDQLDAEHKLPVLFITQALGLAMGIDAKALGLHRHMVPAMALQPVAASKA
jgi:heterodisulfide reductase subunit B